jgi:hypothetical protein
MPTFGTSGAPRDYADAARQPVQWQREYTFGRPSAFGRLTAWPQVRVMYQRAPASSTRLIPRRGPRGVGAMAVPAS